MKPKVNIILILIFLVLNSCDLISDFIPQKEKESNGIEVRKTYYEKSDVLKSEITVKNNKKNGPAKKYYDSGELHTLVHYVNSVKEGKTVWYYKNGNPYRVTKFKNGKKEGVRKIYYEEGKLQAEIPYSNDELQMGTKEYDKKGNLIKKIPDIQFTEIDYLKFEGRFILQIFLSNKSKRVKFYENRTLNTDEKALFPLKIKNGIAEIEYTLLPGYFEMKRIDIVAEYKSNLGNPFLLKGSYNLAIEN
jgi:hypothetical protein